MNTSSQLWQPEFDRQIAYGHNQNGKAYPPNKWKEANAAGSMSTTQADFEKFYTALINGELLKKESFEQMTKLQTRIKSLRQFGPLSLIDSSLNENIQLGYGFGVGVFQSPYGPAFFKEGNDDGWQHYSICFPEKKIAVFIMTNSDNGSGIFKDLLEFSIGDSFTPWQWEDYIPYYLKKSN